MDMNPDEIASRADLVAFVNELRLDLLANRDEWENPTLEGFLEAIEAWITDEGRWSPGFKDAVAWRYLGNALAAAQIYE